MPSNTVYRPSNVGQFEYSKLNYSAQGVRATPSLNTTTNLDLTVSDDFLITGFWLVGEGLAAGDHIDLQVVDPGNLLGLGEGAVVNQFATNIYLPSGSFHQDFDVAYPAKIFATLTLRVIYHSTSLVGSPAFAVNYKLHKVLV